MVASRARTFYIYCGTGLWSARGACVQVADYIAWLRAEMGPVAADAESERYQHALRRRPPAIPGGGPSASLHPASCTIPRPMTCAISSTCAGNALSLWSARIRCPRWRRGREDRSCGMTVRRYLNCGVTRTQSPPDRGRESGASSLSPTPGVARSNGGACAAHYSAAPFSRPAKPLASTR